MSLCYSQLTLSDRRRLHQLMERKIPVGEIAPANSVGIDQRSIVS
ncbi:hypothetical protein [Sinorhizobium meliloti]